MKPVIMPKLGLTMKEGIIAKWLKKEGENVKKGEPVVEIETEKAVSEVEAPISGVLGKILAPEGSTVSVGKPIAIIIEPGEKLPPIEEISVLEAEEIERLSIRPPLEELVKVAKVIPMTGMRKTISERLSQSYRTAVHVTITTDVDMTKIIELRQRMLPEIEKVTKVPLTYTHILVKAVAHALKKHPIINSRLEDEQIKIFEDINIGVAVAVEEGLVVPVIRNVDKKSLTEIVLCLKNLIEKAEQGRLSSDDLSGGTFTITNLGMFGVNVFTPVINPPQSAILGVGAIVNKPVVVNGQIALRPMMTLNLVFDHRIIDGVPAAKFLQTLKGILENPEFLTSEEKDFTNT